MSTPASVLRDAFAHHVWAMGALFDALDVAPERLDASIPGTYGSILATLTHTVDADERYLQRLIIPDPPPPVDHGAQSVAVLRERMSANAGRWSDMLGALETGTLRAMIVDQEDGDIDPAENLLLNQALHHGNDHRTQICSTLGALGQAVPDLDVWTFWDAERR